MVDLCDGSVKNSQRLAFSLFTFLKAHCFFDYPRGTKTLPKSKDISVLIPCYGKADTIERAVKSALNQTMKPFQIIVLLMDEASKAKKNELEILEKSIKCVESERLNVCLARNKLVELCPTEYFIFLDGDDELTENFIETVYLDENSLVFTPCFFSRQDIKDIEYDIFMQKKNVFLDNNPTGLFNKTVFKELGGFNERYKNGAEDTDLFIRLLLLNKYAISFNTKTKYIYNESLGGFTKSKEFFDSCFTILNDYFKSYFKENYGYDSWDVNPRIFKFVKSCKDEITQADLNGLFKDYAGMDADDMPPSEFKDKVGAMLYGEVVKKKMASFSLDLTCNANCPYCFQAAQRKSCKKLSEDEMFNRFDKALSKCDELLGYPVVVQILGGEPTLWSDSLQKRIQERIKGYGKYLLYTNGYDKKSRFWNDPNASINWHITDWEKMEKIDSQGRKDFDVKIIVTKKNIHLVDQYLKLNKGVNIYVTFCHGAGKEFDLDLEDIKQLAVIEYDNQDSMDIQTRVNLNFYENYINHGLEKMQSHCKGNLAVWNFNCYKNEVSPCCYEKAESYKIDEFKGQDISCCGDCFMFY